VREVDLKLIELAKVLEAKIITNDFNLNKVAQLRGVEVLNINELANSLKPIVLPGETMQVFILKEGKEYNQGVAYLDDGTMVVVDNARKMIGKTIDVVGHQRAADHGGENDFWESGMSAPAAGMNRARAINAVPVASPARAHGAKCGCEKVTAH
jgi:F0F1-type ATP synthase alpha subunit